MFQKNINTERKKAIQVVVNYIIKNIDGNLSLKELANLANYSEFHFQKIFKEEMKESPKQFIIKIRLESAVHELIIHQHKSIKEISYDCGFSSPAIFSRAFKNYYGITPEEMQNSNPTERLLLRANSFRLINKLEYEKLEYKKNGIKKILNIEVKRMNSLSAIFVNSDLHDETIIQKSFKDVIKIANIHDIIYNSPMLIGAVYPHLDLYRACIEINPEIPLSGKIEKIIFKSGKYATFKVKGTIEDLFNSLLAFREQWLPDSGWQIAEMCGFEFFSKNPSLVPYNKIEREVYIPIEAE